MEYLYTLIYLYKLIIDDQIRSDVYRIQHVPRLMLSLEQAYFARRIEHVLTHSLEAFVWTANSLICKLNRAHHYIVTRLGGGGGAIMLLAGFTLPISRQTWQVVSGKPTQENQETINLGVEST